MYIDFVSNNSVSAKMRFAFPKHTQIYCPYNLRRYPGTKDLTLEEVFTLNGAESLYSTFNNVNTTITLAVDYINTTLNLYAGLVLIGLRKIDFKGVIKIFYLSGNDLSSVKRNWYLTAHMTLSYILSSYYSKYVQWFIACQDYCGSKEELININGVSLDLTPMQHYFDIVNKRFGYRTSNSVSGIVHYLINNPKSKTLGEDEAGEIIDIMIEKGLLKIEAEAFDGKGKFNRDEIVKVTLKPGYYDAVSRLDLIKRYFTLSRDKSNRYILKAITDDNQVMRIIYYPQYNRFYHYDERITAPQAIALATHRDIIEVLDEINDVLGIDYLDYILEAELADGRLITRK